MKNNFLFTLKEAIDEFQGKKRLEIEDWDERNSFNAARHLSRKIGYADQTTVWKFINKSTSKIKFGVDDLVNICIEIENIDALEVLLGEVKEQIKKKRERRRNLLQEELKFFED